LHPFSDLFVSLKIPQSHRQFLSERPAKEQASWVKAKQASDSGCSSNGNHVNEESFLTFAPFHTHAHTYNLHNFLTLRIMFHKPFRGRFRSEQFARKTHLILVESMPSFVHALSEGG
jgi:hypothetical protein